VYLEHLTLINFRNYARLDLGLSPAGALIVGDNAQGKSNLLEAIYYLATTRSFRASAERELIHWLAWSEETPFARLIGQVRRRTGPEPLRLEITLLAGAERRPLTPAGPAEEENNHRPPALQKRIRINGVPRRVLDLFGQVNAVFFAPTDLDLVSGSPALRRRYLDTLLSQVDRSYLRALARYTKVLTQRNALLRQWVENRRPAEITFWDDELVAQGSLITASRQTAVARLNELLTTIYPRIAGERLNMTYRSSIPLEPVPQAGQITQSDTSATDEAVTAVAAAFRSHLKSLHRRELRAGLSLVGPHRDDLLFQVDGADARAYASRGQQRSIAIALKLAEVAYLRHVTGDDPILLLDDVLSELDATRQRALLASLNPSQQVVVTATHRAIFPAELLARIPAFQVRAGSLTPL